MSSTQFSVIIPAHNEASVIPRCLSAIYEGAEPSAVPEVIVVANGCTDDTAQIARRFVPQVEVIELAEPSKTAAMNAGRKRASHFPQVFLDADVQCSLKTLSAIVDAIKAGALAAAPIAHFELRGASWPVRSYYRAWAHQPYAQRALGGSGCFALSQAALTRIGPFPDVIADDFWAMSRFNEDKRVIVRHDAAREPVFTRIFPPRTILQQIRVDARRRAGTEQVRRDYPSASMAAQTSAGPVRSALSSGSSSTDTIIFLAVKAASTALGRWRKFTGREKTWFRDESSRTE